MVYHDKFADGKCTEATMHAVHRLCPVLDRIACYLSAWLHAAVTLEQTTSRYPVEPQALPGLKFSLLWGYRTELWGASVHMLWGYNTSQGTGVADVHDADVAMF
jgi:hypothetical protein